MRWMLCGLVLVGCEGFDPRPECSWTIDVLDAADLHVDLRMSTPVACTPPETAPDRLLIEAVMIDGQPYEGEELSVVCDSGNHFTALQVEGLAEGGHAIRPFEADQPGVITYEDVTVVSESSWVHISYQESQDDGSVMSEEPWGVAVKQGSPGRILAALECYER